MRKLDRFEREAYKLTTELYAQADSHGEKLALGKIDCAAAISILLRREHAWMRGMVKQYRTDCIPPGNERCVEAWEAVPIIEKVCADLLSKLTQRRK